MTRTRALAVVAATAVAVAVATPGAATQAPEPAREPTAEETDTDVLKARIAEADRDVRAARARLAAAQDRLAELDQQAADAAAELALIDAQLRVARVAQRAAVDTATSVAGRSARDGRVVTAQRAAADTAQAELVDHVVWMWKHGPAAQLELQLALVGGAQGGHDLALGQRVVDEVVAASRGEVFDAQRHLAQVVAARDVSVRDDARRVAFDAGLEVASVDVLRRRQLQATVRLATLRSEQDQVVADLSRDRDAMAALATQLRRTLARVSLSGALVPPADLPLQGPPPPWTDLLPASGQPWAPAIDAIATRYGVSGSLFTALVWSESGFNAAAVSSAGAVGLAQLMPATAAALGVDPWNPYENLAGGARYLHAMIVRFGAADLGLAAYNAGPGRVERAGNTIPDIVETQLYVVRVLERWERLRAAT